MRKRGMKQWDGTPSGRFSPKLTEKQMNDLIFQPWFLPKSTYVTIARMVPREYLLRMRDYFERYGCMRCGCRTKLHFAHGMCADADISNNVGSVKSFSSALLRSLQ